MFYLRFLWGQFKVLPGKFIIVVALPWLMVASLKIMPLAVEKISHGLIGSRPTSYVNLICSDEELAKFLETRVKALPLIAKVEEYAMAQIQGAVAKTLDDLEIKSADQDSLKKMVGLKISFDQQVSAREFELIKGHLNRLAATKEIIWGPFINIPHVQNYSDYLDWALYGTVLIILYLVWIFNFFPIKNLLSQSVYLIERYQRRSQVYPKIMTFFIIVNVCVGLQLLGQKMPLFFYGVFVLLTTMCIIEVRRPWKKV